MSCWAISFIIAQKYNLDKHLTNLIAKNSVLFLTKTVSII